MSLISPLLGTQTSRCGHNNTNTSAHSLYNWMRSRSTTNITVPHYLYNWIHDSRSTTNITVTSPCSPSSHTTSAHSLYNWMYSGSTNITVTPPCSPSSHPTNAHSLYNWMSPPLHYSRSTTTVTPPSSRSSHNVLSWLDSSTTINNDPPRSTSCNNTFVGTAARNSLSCHKTTPPSLGIFQMQSSAFNYSWHSFYPHAHPFSTPPFLYPFPVSFPVVSRIPQTDKKENEIEESEILVKRTYRPNVHKGKKKHGFLARTKTKKGRQILGRRRRKGRWRLTSI